MTSKAHLCLKCEFVGRKIEVVGFGVFSASALNITCIGDCFYSDVLDWSGANFHEAREALLNALPSIMPHVAAHIAEHGEV